MKFATTHFARNQEEQDRLDHLQSQVKWAEKVLAAPNVVYPNGRESHEVANQVYDECQDELIDFLGIVAV